METNKQTHPLVHMKKQKKVGGGAGKRKKESMRYVVVTSRRLPKLPGPFLKRTLFC